MIAHGFFNSKSALLLQELQAALADEYDIFLLDFRGHGNSGGLFSWTSQEHLDLEAALSQVEGEYAKIGVVGFSLGGATSLVAASRQARGARQPGIKIGRMDSLVAVCSPAAFEKIEYHFWQLDFENDIWYNLAGEGRIGKGVRPGPFWWKKERPLDVVQQISIPILFLHGEKDWLIKPWHSQILYDRAAKYKRLAIIQNGPHAEYLIRKNKQETIRLIREWFKETL